MLKDGVMMLPAEIHEAIGMKRFVDPPPITKVERKAP